MPRTRLTTKGKPMDTKPISRLRHADKLTLVRMCQAKEKAGWECIRKIQRVETYTKDFDRDGKFYTYAGGRGSGFWEAIYQMEVVLSENTPQERKRRAFNSRRAL